MYDPNARDTRQYGVIGAPKREGMVWFMEQACFVIPA